MSRFKKLLAVIAVLMTGGILAFLRIALNHPESTFSQFGLALAFLYIFIYIFVLAALIKRHK